MNTVILLPSLAWITSLVGTATVLPILRKRMLDMPNARSNHKTPVPRGGGIVMIAVALLCFFLIGVAPLIIIAGLLLAAVSFADDMRGMPVSIRFLTQFIAVGLAMTALPGRLLPEIVPIYVEWAFIALAWLWFINLTNFMDGIDGISALQTVMMMLGIILIQMFAGPIPFWLTISAAVLAGCALGFLRFNLSPAKLFMGDVGSIPLGFLNGFLLLCLAIYGHMAAALILPAYYVTDATRTLIKRGLRGEKVWQAHSEHAYQKAVRGGMSHNAVVGRITMLNALFVALALCPAHTMMAGVITCTAAYVAALILVCRLSKCSS